MKTLALVAALLLASRASGQSVSNVIDLGHPLSDRDPSWSGEKGFSHTAIGSVDSGGVFMGRFSSDEHFGTHVDAPAHFAKAGWTVDRIPVDRLVRPAVTLHIETEARQDEDYRLTLADVKAFEARHGAIPDGAIVLISTGWSERWPGPRYMNERNRVKHFPGISVDAAAYLARDRRVAGIAIDTPSVDHGPSATFETHRTTMPLNVYHVENATNLTALPATGFTVVVAPIKIAGGSGGPTRIFALLR